MKSRGVCPAMAVPLSHVTPTPPAGPYAPACPVQASDWDITESLSISTYESAPSTSMSSGCHVSTGGASLLASHTPVCDEIHLRLQDLEAILRGLKTAACQARCNAVRLLSKCTNSDGYVDCKSTRGG